MALGDNEAARFGVWFRVHFGHQRLTRLCRRMTDAVDKRFSRGE
jgi:hypothetical protein